MKLCKDCKYYDSNGIFCLRWTVEVRDINLVTGDIRANPFTERKYGRCGIEAKGFEPNL